MPKLKEDSLKRRYPCQYCGKSFPTKQGLSGHIQFKHQKKFIKEPDLPITPEITKKLKAIEIIGLSIIPLGDIFDMIKYWLSVKSMCLAFNIELNQQDLKHYMITSLVQIYQNQRLTKKIINALSGMTSE